MEESENMAVYDEATQETEEFVRLYKSHGQQLLTEIGSSSPSLHRWLPEFLRTTKSDICMAIGKYLSIAFFEFPAQQFS